MARLGRGFPVQTIVETGQRSSFIPGSATAATTTTAAGSGVVIVPGDTASATTTTTTAAGRVIGQAASTTATVASASATMLLTGDAGSTTETSTGSSGPLHLTGSGSSATTTSVDLSASMVLTCSIESTTSTSTTAFGVRTTFSGSASTTTTSVGTESVTIVPGDTVSETITECIARGTLTHPLDRPVVSTVAERLYRAMGCMADGDQAEGWPLLLFCHALCASLQAVEDVAADLDDDPFTDDYRATYGRTAPGWSQLFDGVRCPDWALPYLGQFVGVEAVRNEDADTLRARIVDAAGWRRGTLATITAAGKAAMIGAKRLTITERNGDNAYRIGVLTTTADVPNETAFRRAILDALPAGIAVDWDIRTRWKWVDLDTEYDGDPWSTFDGDFATWAEVDAHEAVIP